MEVRYESGEEIRAGDKVRFHGDEGQILFVITQRTGDAALDWFLHQYPGGGFMVLTPTMGEVFMQATDSDFEDLEFISHVGERSERD